MSGGADVLPLYPSSVERPGNGGLRRGARVLVRLSPGDSRPAEELDRRSFEGAALLVRYVRSPIGRAPLQVWRVEFQTVYNRAGAELPVPEGARDALRIVDPADVLPEAAP